MEAQPKAEAVGEGDLLLHGLAGVDGGAALVVHHGARQQVAPVRGGVEQHIGRTPLDAAFQHRLQGLVGGVLRIEGQIVAKEDEGIGRWPHPAHEGGQGLDVLAVDLHELHGAEIGLGGPRGVDLRMDRLHQRGLAHAARAPQQRIVGGQAPGETLRIFHQQVAHEVDAPQQADVHTVHLRHRREAAGGRMPDEGVRRRKVDAGVGLGGEAVEGAGDALQRGENGLGLSGHGASCRV